MGDELEVHRFNLEIKYEADNKPVVVDNREVAKIRRRRFQFRTDKEFFRSCLTYGAAAIAGAATVYFLRDQFSVTVTPVASNSVIYEVVVPNNSSSEFEKLMQNQSIQNGLCVVFKDIENYLENILGKGYKTEIANLEQLKKIRITSVELCDEKTLKKVLDVEEIDEDFSKPTKEEAYPSSKAAHGRSETIETVPTSKAFIEKLDRSKHITKLKETCKEIFAKSEFSRAALHLEYLDFLQSLDKLDTILQLAECYSRLEKATKQARYFIMNSPRFTANYVFDLGVGFMQKSAYTSARILFRIASDMYETSARSPDEVINGIFSCITQTHNATAPMIKTGGRRRILAIQYRIEFMKQMLSKIKTVKNANPDNKAMKEVLSMMLFGYNLSLVGESEKGLEIRQTGVKVLEQQFGSSSSKYNFYGVLLQSIGWNFYNTNRFSEAENYYLRAIDVYEKATDWNYESKKQECIEDSKKWLKITRAKLNEAKVEDTSQFAARSQDRRDNLSRDIEVTQTREVDPEHKKIHEVGKNASFISETMETGIDTQCTSVGSFLDDNVVEITSSPELGGIPGSNKASSLWYSEATTMKPEGTTSPIEMSYEKAIRDSKAEMKESTSLDAEQTRKNVIGKSDISATTHGLQERVLIENSQQDSESEEKFSSRSHEKNKDVSSDNEQIPTEESRPDTNATTKLAEIPTTGQQSLTSKQLLDEVRTLCDELRRKFQEGWKRTARKTIGVEGGAIELSDSRVTIPPGTMEKEENIELTISSQPDDFPGNLLAITPVLKCRPAMKFKDDITVSTESWYTAREGEEITAQIMHREGNGPWKSIANITLNTSSRLEFRISHFCPYVVAVSQDLAQLSGEHHLVNDVFIQRGSGMVASVFFRDHRCREQQEKFFADSNYERALFMPEDIIVEYDSTIDLRVICKRPTNTEISEGRPSPNLKIDGSFLRRACHVIYFVPVQVLVLDEGDEWILMDYDIKINQSDRVSLPLSVVWPAHDSLSPPPVRLDVHGAETVNQTTGHNIATGGAHLTSTSTRARNTIKVTTRPMKRRRDQDEH